jgi:MOSC domain-containing protein
VPVVSRISIAPVKGLALVHPDEVTLERTGVAANRRFHIVDADGRRYNQLRNGQLVRIKPAYDPESGRLTLRFPDGAVADGTVVLGREITTDFYGRPVAGNLVVGPWSDALSTWAGRPLRLVQSAPGAAGRPQARQRLPRLDRVGGRAGPARRTERAGRRPSLPHALPAGRL